MSKAEAPAKVTKPNIFKRIANYFKDLRSETKKVVWPTKTQIINNTIIVLVTIIVLGIFIALLDFGLGALVNFLLNRA